MSVRTSQNQDNLGRSIREAGCRDGVSTTPATAQSSDPLVTVPQPYESLKSLARLLARQAAAEYVALQEQVQSQ